MAIRVNFALSEQKHFKIFLKNKIKTVSELNTAEIFNFYVMKKSCLCQGHDQYSSN